MSTRTYVFDDKKMEFNVNAFKRVFDTYRRSKKITNSKLEEQLAETLGIATDTVHGWHYGKNTPSGIEYVKELATALELTDFTLLLTENNGGQDMNRLTDRQMSAAKRIYDICIWFLDEFNHTDGFNDYWLTFSERGSDDPESAIYDHIEGLIRKINLVLDQEYFDLHNCDIYDEFCEYVSEDLLDIYDGKVSYAYRFEAMPGETPTTSEDYDKAMLKLNSILEKHLV